MEAKEQGDRTWEDRKADFEDKHSITKGTPKEEVDKIIDNGLDGDPENAMDYYEYFIDGFDDMTHRRETMEAFNKKSVSDHRGRRALGELTVSERRMFGRN